MSEEQRSLEEKPFMINAHGTKYILYEDADKTARKLLSQLTASEAKAAKAEVLNEFYLEGIEKSEAKVTELELDKRNLEDIETDNSMTIGFMQRGLDERKVEVEGLEVKLTAAEKENERIPKLQAMLGQAKVDIEALEEIETDLNNTIGFMASGIEDNVARIKELEGALQDIIDIRNGFHRFKAIGKCSDMWKRAVKALKA